jgi:hypothetical protein
MKALIKAVIRIIILVIGIQLLFAIFNEVSWFFTDNVFSDKNTLKLIEIIIGVGIIELAVLFVMWKKTSWLVKILAGDINDNILAINTSNLALISIAIQILGIYMIVNFLPDLLGLTYNRFRMQQIYAGYSNSELGIQEIKLWVITIAKLLIGIWLASGSKWLVKRLKGSNNSEETKDKEEHVND